MLRQLLIHATAITLALSAQAQGEEDRNAIFDSAQKAMRDTSKSIRKTFDRADVLLQQGNEVADEIAVFSNIEAAPLSSLEGIAATKPNIDIDALYSKYESELGHSIPKSDNTHLLIFVSSSVPKGSLKRLASDAARAGATLVLRGIVGDGLKSTAEFINEMFDGSEDKPKAVIDPSLFSRYKTTQVPAVIYSPSSICMGGSTRCPSDVGDHIHVAGDVSLMYAVEYMKANNKRHKNELELLINKMEGLR